MSALRDAKNVFMRVWRMSDDEADQMASTIGTKNAKPLTLESFQLDRESQAMSGSEWRDITPPELSRTDAITTEQKTALNVLLSLGSADLCLFLLQSSVYQ